MDSIIIDYPHSTFGDPFIISLNLYFSILSLQALIAFKINYTVGNRKTALLGVKNCVHQHILTPQHFFHASEPITQVMSIQLEALFHDS